MRSTGQVGPAVTEPEIETRADWSPEVVVLFAPVDDAIPDVHADRLSANPTITPAIATHREGSLRMPEARGMP
jgi:hypothetical protein